jgi:hypothetical protein
MLTLLAKMPATLLRKLRRAKQNIISTFVILFNFITVAERQEFYSGTSAMREPWQQY